MGARCGWLDQGSMPFLRVGRTGVSADAWLVCGEGMSKRERYLMRVREDGSFVPDDEHTRARLRQKKYRVGNLVAAELYRARNPGFHRLAHAFGQLVSDHIDGFEHMDAHQVLKRLQVEADVGCDVIPMRIPGVGPVEYRVPKSLSFENMDEPDFRQVFWALCDHVSKTYWPSLSAESVAEMAEMMEVHP